MNIKTAEEIFNKHSWEALGGISPSKYFCVKAMKEYAEQFIELAAETADVNEDIYTGEFTVSEESILKIKEQIK